MINQILSNRIVSVLNWRWISSVRLHTVNFNVWFHSCRASVRLSSATLTYTLVLDVAVHDALLVIHKKSFENRLLIGLYSGRQVPCTVQFSSMPCALMSALRFAPRHNMSALGFLWSRTWHLPSKPANNLYMSAVCISNIAPRSLTCSKVTILKPASRHKLCKFYANERLGH